VPEHPLLILGQRQQELAVNSCASDHARQAEHHRPDSVFSAGSPYCSSLIAPTAALDQTGNELSPCSPMT
jgi:hypothetical protein